MTDKEKYDFIDHVVNLALFEEDRLLNEHGGDYSGLEEDGIDSNEYYRIITERVINTPKKNNYIQEEPVSEELEEAIGQSFIYHDNHGDDFRSDKQIETAYRYGFESGAKWQKEKDDEEKVLTYKHGYEDSKKQMMAKAIDAHCFGFQGSALFSFKLPADNYLVGSEVKVIVIKED